MNSLSGSDTGGVFGASVVEVFKPEFFIVAPKIDLSIISTRFPS